MPRLKPESLRLYLVTDRSLSLGRSLQEVVLAAVQGGVTCVQLREKQADTREFVQWALALKALLGPLQIPLVINDRIDVALACRADGVHLGQSDMPVEHARRLLPPEVFLGWSVETENDIDRAHQLPVDYLGVSPVFSTATKTDTAPPWGLAGLARARRQTRLPLVAIGGIHSGNAGPVLAAGADGLAVVSAISSAKDPSQAARELIGQIQAHFESPSNAFLEP